MEVKGQFAEQFEDIVLVGIPLTVGVLAGIATFLGAWIYCASEYGFLFGFGLGWIASGILAAIIGFTLRFLFWPIVSLGVLVALWLWKSQAA